MRVIALVAGFAWWWNTVENSRTISGTVPSSTEALRRDMTVYNQIGNPSRVMLRRSVLADVGVFSETIRWGQDWEMWLRVIARHQAAILPTPVIVYRWHEHNLSHTRRWQRLGSYWNISRNAIHAYQPVWRRPFLLLRSWSLYTLRRARLALEQNSRGLGFVYAVAALFAYPQDGGRSKLKIFLRSIVGDTVYEHGKRFVRSRLQARGER